MGLDGEGTDVHSVCDFRIVQTGGQMVQDGLFPRRELLNCVQDLRGSYLILADQKDQVKILTRVDDGPALVADFLIVELELIEQEFDFDLLRGGNDHGAKVVQ